MSAVPAFLGGANTLASITADADLTINLILERVQPGNAKSQAYFRNTPGIRPFASLSGSPNRGEFYQDGRAFVVGGDQFDEIFSDGSGINYGSVTNDGLPVSFASNGSAGGQVLVISGGNGYIFNLTTNTLTQITDPDFPTGRAAMCAFLDGYFLVLVKNSRQFQISALEDGTSWDALDVAERSRGSDNIIAMIRNHTEIWFRGSQTTEVWYDNGDPFFPFAPIPGVFVESGTAAPFGVCRSDNTIWSVELDERGQGVITTMEGYTPSRVSTYAVELDLARSADLSAAQLFSFKLQGHLFIVVYVPDLTVSWLYDIAEGAWYQWALWNTTTCAYFPHVATSAVFAFQKVLLGDRQSGTVYDCSFDYFNDEVVAP